MLGNTFEPFESAATALAPATTLTVAWTAEPGETLEFRLSGRAPEVIHLKHLESVFGPIWLPQFDTHATYLNTLFACSKLMFGSRGVLV